MDDPGEKGSGRGMVACVGCVSNEAKILCCTPIQASKIVHLTPVLLNLEKYDKNTFRIKGNNALTSDQPPSFVMFFRSSCVDA